MLEQLVQKPYQRFFVMPIAVILKNIVSPLQLTFLGGVLGILIIPALLFQHTYLAACLLIFSGFCDTLDGCLARLTQQTSDLGSVLDILMDRVVEFSVIIGIWLIDSESRSLLCLLMLGGILLCVTSFLVVGIFTANTSHKSFYYSQGLMERAEAFIIFIAIILFPKNFNLLASLFIVLINLTMLIRVFEFAKFNLKRR